MKKLILAATLFSGITITSFAQNSTGSGSQTMTNTAGNTLKYWYYPSQNIYQDQTSNNYWYYDEPTRKWVSGNKLPDRYDMKTITQRYEIAYKGTDIWKDNKLHKTKFKLSDGILPKADSTKH